VKYFVREKADLRPTLELLASRADAFWNWKADPVMEISFSPAKSRRTLDQNAMFWEWMERLSTYFTQAGRTLTKDQAHDLMCHTFLGYEDYTVGETHIRRMKTTTRPKLGVEDFSYFMEQIDAWAADKGCLLPSGADISYERHLKAQKKRGRKK